MPALLLSAGASFDAGMPLVTELTAELRRWLTPQISSACQGAVLAQRKSATTHHNAYRELARDNADITGNPGIKNSLYCRPKCLINLAPGCR
jgi:hypothetical protein